MHDHDYETYLTALSEKVKKGKMESPVNVTFAGVVLNLTQTDFENSYGKTYGTTRERSTLQPHQDNPHILREITEVMENGKTFQIVAFADFLTEKMLLCSSHVEPQVTELKPAFKARLNSRYGLTQEGFSPPAF